MSHQIDFKCHDSADEWNGHWACSGFKWKLIRGKRPYFINREPHSVHINLLNQTGFNVVCDVRIKSESTLDRKKIAPQFDKMSEDDLTTSGTFTLAEKLSP